jgi:hypothetical protein
MLVPSCSSPSAEAPVSTFLKEDYGRRPCDAGEQPTHLLEKLVDMTINVGVREVEERHHALGLAGEGHRERSRGGQAEVRKWRGTLAHRLRKVFKVLAFKTLGDVRPARIVVV